MKHFFVLNPVAGAKTAEKLILPKILEAAKAEGVDYEIHRTMNIGDGEKYVINRCLTFPDESLRFYAVGGDGTLNEVVNGAYGFSNAEIAFIPAGTGNDFVRIFEGQKNFSDIRKQIRGQAIPIDAIRYSDGSKDRFIINVLNIGLDCDVVAEKNKISENLKINGPLAYLAGVAVVFAGNRGFPMIVTLQDGRVLDEEFTLIAVGNGSFYGGGFKGVPEASINDGLLDVSLVRKVNRRTFASLIGKYKKGTHLKSKLAKSLITYKQCRSLTIEPKGAMQICVDGEIFDSGTIDISIVPGAVKFSLPEGSRLKDDNTGGKAMIAKKMEVFVAGGSAIRAMFEEGRKMAEEFGPENVCDFSLGNPNLAAPDCINKSIIEILKEEDPIMVHGYMNNSGFHDVRQAIAESINRRQGTSFNKENIIMTVGAAGGLNVVMNTFLNMGEEVMVFAPYFGEYKSYALSYDAVFTAVPANIPTFQPNLEEFEKMISPKTKVVIINSPNNPTGVVYTEETIRKMAGILEEKQRKFKTDICLVSDEPYRELAYDGIDVPYITKYYDNSIVAYSFSKSLSLAGERIGYLVIPDTIKDYESVYSAANISNRILGFVNAPSLMQRAVARCVDEQVNVGFYDANRKAIYEGLTGMGYECIYPEGAFYLWMKTPIEDKDFCDMAKKHQLLMVAGSYFGCPGYVRLAYCVSPKTIETALPKFKALMEEIKAL